MDNTTHTITIVFETGDTITFNDVPGHFLDFCLFLHNFYGEGVINNYVVHAD